VDAYFRGDFGDPFIGAGPDSSELDLNGVVVKIRAVGVGR
jgi:hypothetical protein